MLTIRGCFAYGIQRSKRLCGSLRQGDRSSRKYWAGALPIVGLLGSLLGTVSLAQLPPVPDGVPPRLPERQKPWPTERGDATAPTWTGVRIRADEAVRQGETLKATVEFPPEDALGIAKSEYYATLAGRRARLFLQRDGSLMALLPVSVFQKPGVYPLAFYDRADHPLKQMPVRVLDGRYRTQNVSVSRTVGGLQPLPGELEAIQALKDTVSAARYWGEPFISPTPDCQNSPFGVKRLHNGVPTGDYHKGVDLRSPAGRPIRATNGGTVQIARMYRLHGGTVGLDHGQGVSSIYIHMSRIAVRPGEQIRKGDVIGYVGSTGFASGPHLHWGMYVSGLPVNPNQWVHGVPRCN